MGRQQRRRQARNKQNSPQQQTHQLGAPGPFMVCRECREPLCLYSRVSEDGATEKTIAYLHTSEYVDEDGIIRWFSLTENHHPAVPTEALPIDAKTTCDFCHEPLPRWVFVPRKPIRIHDSASNGLLDYSSPWSCCGGCLPPVKHKDLTRMLDRAVRSDHGVLAGMPMEARQAFRPGIRKLYAAYLKSDPTGPYERQIRSDARVGHRSSRQGGNQR